MQIDMSVLMGQLEKFLVMIFLGFLAGKTGLLSQELHQKLNTVIMRAIVPALLISNMAASSSQEGLRLLLPMTLGGFCVFLLLVGLGQLSGRLMGFKGDKLRVQTGITFMGSIGFFGIPLASSLLGSLGTVAFGLFSIVDNLTVWTVGLMMSRGESRKEAFSWKCALRRLVQPATVAVFLGLVLLVFRVPGDGLVMDSLATIGNCANPLAMLCIGAGISQTPWGKLAAGWPAVSVVVLRMTLAPLLVYRVCVLLGVYQPAAVCLTLVTAMPSSSMFALMCRENQNTESEYASGAAVLTVLCSVITIPFVVGSMG